MDIQLNTPAARAILDAAAIKVPEHLYHGGGKAWAAFAQSGEMVGMIYMGKCRTLGLEDIGRKRYTRAAISALDHAQSQAFTAFREESRAALANLGTVVSGMCSGTFFYPKHAEDAAFVANLTAAV